MNQNVRVNKTNFHMKGFAPGLASKQRRKATRKSPWQRHSPTFNTTNTTPWKSNTNRRISSKVKKQNKKTRHNRKNYVDTRKGGVHTTCIALCKATSVLYSTRTYISSKSIFCNNKKNSFARIKKLSWNGKQESSEAFIYRNYMQVRKTRQRVFGLISLIYYFSFVNQADFI